MFMRRKVLFVVKSFQHHLYLQVLCRVLCYSAALNISGMLSYYAKLVPSYRIIGKDFKNIALMAN